MANSNGAIDWDDEVSSADAGDNAQSDDIVVLPDGIYPCKVMKVERGSFKGSQKLPPCNKVKVGVIIDGGDAGPGWSDHNFYMHSDTRLEHQDVVSLLHFFMRWKQKMQRKVLQHFVSVAVWDALQSLKETN